MVYSFSRIVVLLIVFGLKVVSAASHHPQAFLNSIEGKKDEAEQIVQHYCLNCHAVNPAIPLGAPRIHDLSDWGPRLKQGLDILFKHTDEGMNAMPPRGGCFECSDRQLNISINFMLPKKVDKSME